MNKNEKIIKILLSVWGNFKNWKPIKYCYNSFSKTSKSSFPIIKQVENPNYSVIIISDTLLNQALDNNNNIQNYKMIKDLLKDDTNNFCNSEFSFTANEVIISYGFGEFDKTKFTGNAMDFYYNLFKELAFYFTDLISKLDNNKIDIEVIFDATHGLNYNIILTYKALIDVLEILAYCYDIKLKVLNSDPLIGSNTNILNINIIQETKVLPKLNVFRSDKRPIEPYFNLNNDEKKEFGLLLKQLFNDNFSKDYKQKIYKDYKEKIYLFLGSFSYALPTLVFTYLIDFCDLKKSIQLISAKFEENIKINFLNKIEIKRTLEYRENFANFIKAFIVSFILNKFNFKQLQDIPLSKIKDLSGTFFENFPIKKNRIDKEIKDIEEIFNHIENDYKVYGVIKNKLRNQNVNFNLKVNSDKNDNSNNVDKRNFFAHSGFEYNSIELKKLGDEIYIKVRDDKINEINRLILNSLSKID
jgi:CRISPR-associated protein Csx1